MQMARNENDPDLNLQSFNDHGIFTIDELNELFPVVKPYFSALYLNITSLNQHFADLCNLLDSGSPNPMRVLYHGLDAQIVG